VWDCAGQERLTGLRDGYYICAQAVILAFDLSKSKSSFEKMKTFAWSVRRVVPDIPCVIVGMKHDISDFEDNAIETPFEIIKVSSKAGENCDLPFLKLAKALKGDPSLQFSESV